MAISDDTTVSLAKHTHGVTLEAKLPGAGHRYQALLRVPPMPGNPITGGQFLMLIPSP